MDVWWGQRLLLFCAQQIEVGAACGPGQSGPCMHANSFGQGQRRGEISDRLQRFPEAQDLHPTSKKIE